jgi:hypothetical protein
MEWMWKEVVVAYYDGICLESLEETTKRPQDSWYPVPDSIWWPLKYRWEAFPLEPAFSVVLLWVSSVPPGKFRHSAVSYTTIASYQNPDTSVGIATEYGLDSQGFHSRQGQEISVFSTMSNSGLSPVETLIWYRGFFPRGWSCRGLKLTTHLHLVSRSKVVELYLHSHTSSRRGAYLLN